MSWGIWNTELEGWVGFNNVVFHAPSKAVCTAQIDILKRLVKQQYQMQKERERAERNKAGAPIPPGLVVPGKDGRPMPIGPAIWEPTTEPPYPFEARSFEAWYQKERKGQKDE